MASMIEVQSNMRRFTGFFVAVAFLWTSNPVSAKTSRDIVLSDYFSAVEISNVEIAPDGKQLLASTLVKKNNGLNKERKVVVIDSVPPFRASIPNEIQRGRLHKWHPSQNSITLLDRDDQGDYLSIVDSKAWKIEEEIRLTKTVLKYSLSPSGDRIALLASERGLGKPYNIHDGNTAALVDLTTISFYPFLNPNYTNLSNKQINSLILVGPSREPQIVNIPGSVEDFHWSPDGQRLLISFYRNEGRSAFSSVRATDLGIYFLENEEFIVFFSASVHFDEKSEEDYVHSYRGLGWVDGGDSVLVLNSQKRSVLESSHYLGTVIVSKFSSRPVEQAWLSLGDASRDQFHLIKDDRILVERVTNGRFRLLELINGELFPVQIHGVRSAGVFGFSFSGLSKRVALISEASGMPPEIYIGELHGNFEQASQFNVGLKGISFPKYKEVEWESSDGRRVSGWLIQPTDLSKFEKPWPLVTHLHGGPARPATDSFLQEFQYWPHPLEVLAANGVAVFIPNYRGTSSYGTEHRKFSKMDKEPLDDVIAGIDSLANSGLADRTRLGISGHSHGGWLAGIAIADSDYFIAGSLAESSFNYFSIYSLLSERINQSLHNQYYADPGISPEDALRMSPELQLRESDTAVLLEGGSRSLGAMMIGFAKALRAVNTPTELYMLPDTGHAVEDLMLAEESADRNLDWFLFWLKGVRDKSPKKKEQYARWDEMRLNKCRGKLAGLPSYCNF